MTERGEDGCWESGCFGSCAWRGMAGEMSEGRANRIRPVETELHQNTNPPDGCDAGFTQVEQIYGCGIVFNVFFYTGVQQPDVSISYLNVNNTIVKMKYNLYFSSNRTQIVLQMTECGEVHYLYTDILSGTRSISSMC